MFSKLVSVHGPLTARKNHLRESVLLCYVFAMICKTKQTKKGSIRLEHTARPQRPKLPYLYALVAKMMYNKAKAAS